MTISKKLILVLIGLGLTSQLSACSDEGIEKAEKVVVDKLGNCPMTVPKKMRDLRKTYNKEFSAPDSEGNAQSYEVCKAQIEAAQKYQKGLEALMEYMGENCKDFQSQQDKSNEVDRNNYKKFLRRSNLWIGRWKRRIASQSTASNRFARFNRNLDTSRLTSII